MHGTKLPNRVTAGVGCRVSNKLKHDRYTDTESAKEPINHRLNYLDHARIAEVQRSGVDTAGFGSDNLNKHNGSETGHRTVKQAIKIATFNLFQRQKTDVAVGTRRLMQPLTGYRDDRCRNCGGAKVHNC